MIASFVDPNQVLGDKFGTKEQDPKLTAQQVALQSRNQMGSHVQQMVRASLLQQKREAVCVAIKTRWRARRVATAVAHVRVLRANCVQGRSCRVLNIDVDKDMYRKSVLVVHELFTELIVACSDNP